MVHDRQLIRLWRCGSGPPQAIGRLETMIKTILLLLIEDEGLILDFARLALEDAGYEVVTAAEGAAALGLLDARIEQIAGLITDIRLSAPGPDGWEIARHARELKPAIPVIYTSGDSAADWSAQGVPKSVMLQKPYAPAQLITAVSQLLNQADSGLA